MFFDHKGKTVKANTAQSAVIAALNMKLEGITVAGGGINLDYAAQEGEAEGYEVVKVPEGLQYFGPRYK